MNRTSPALASGAALLLLGLAPTAALAKGWKLELNAKAGGVSTHTVATHCGATKFGMWSFRGTLKHGGEYAQVRWKTQITADGTAHPTSRVTVTGTAPKSAKATLKKTLKSVQYRYVPGATPKLQSQVGSEPATTVPFRPKATKHC